MRLNQMILATAFALSAQQLLAQGQGPLPSFNATSLTGQTVTEQKLIGQPTVLIVTPSRDAAKDTRQWVQALRGTIDPKKVRVRDVIAIDLPFFMSERDALGQAKKKIPERYYDQTWLLSGKSLEKSLSIPPSSDEAYVLVLNAQGEVVVRTHGQPTQDKLKQIEDAVRKLKG